jgi:hypothetical protein
LILILAAKLRKNSTFGNTLTVTDNEFNDITEYMSVHDNHRGKLGTECMNDQSLVREKDTYALGTTYCGDSRCPAAMIPYYSGYLMQKKS